MEIIDDFLPQKQYQAIKDLFFGGRVLWKYADSKTKQLRGTNLEHYNWQFVHMIYKDYERRSEYFDEIMPILNIIKPFALNRIKANCQPRADRIIEYALHNDVSPHKGYTGVFYLNTCNGYTVFEDGRKVESVDNRLLKFDGNLKHAGSSVTDAQRRIVINLNWV